jgi:hypothetical protein
MKDRKIWLVSSLYDLLLGFGLLYAYFNIDVLIAKVLLYLASMLLVTVGTNQFVFFFENLLRRREPSKVPFAEIFIWLSPCLFMLYQVFTLDNFVLKVVCLALAFIFALIFVFAFAAAVSDTAVAKKRINLFVAIILLSLLTFGLSYAFQSTGILLFLPLIFMLSYTDYVRVNYLIESNQSTRNRAGYKGRITNVSHRLFPISLTNPIKETHWITYLLMFFVLIIFIFYVKGLFSLPDTISGLYTVSLMIYTFVLSIIVAFAILVLRPRVNRKRTKAIRRALLGLAQMCLVFILTSLLGILIGLNIDTSVFATGTTLSDIFDSWKLLSLLQVFVFEFILLSFPNAFMYLYAMLKGFLYSGE